MTTPPSFQSLLRSNWEEDKNPPTRKDVLAGLQGLAVELGRLVDEGVEELDATPDSFELIRLSPPAEE